MSLPNIPCLIYRRFVRAALVRHYHFLTVYKVVKLRAYINRCLLVQEIFCLDVWQKICLLSDRSELHPLLHDLFSFDRLPLLDIVKFYLGVLAFLALEMLD